MKPKMKPKMKPIRKIVSVIRQKVCEPILLMCMDVAVSLYCTIEKFDVGTKHTRKMANNTHGRSAVTHITAITYFIGVTTLLSYRKNIGYGSMV